jgi:hypothetical protein
MDIRRKMYDTRIWKEAFISQHPQSTLIHLSPSLYQYVETHSIEVFWLLPQPFPHLRFNIIIGETFSTKVVL